MTATLSATFVRAAKVVAKSMQGFWIIESQCESQSQLAAPGCLCNLVNPESFACKCKACKGSRSKRSRWLEKNLDWRMGDQTNVRGLISTLSGVFSASSDNLIFLVVFFQLFHRVDSIFVSCVGPGVNQ